MRHDAQNGVRGRHITGESVGIMRGCQLATPPKLKIQWLFRRLKRDLGERRINIPRCLRLLYLQMLANHLKRIALYA